MIFDVEADKYADIFTLRDFVDAVVCGAFIPDDGIGYYGTETHYSYAAGVWGCDIGVVTAVENGVTHVHWYNN